MRNYKILIAHNHSSIEVMHSLVPFYLLSKEDSKFNLKFIDYRFLDYRRHKADILILTRKYHQFDHNQIKDRNFIISDIKKYRKRFNKLIYFDDSAAVSHILNFIIPYVDSYWVRGLLVDKNKYEKPFYGGRTFSDYYFLKYGVEDEKKTFSPDFKFIHNKKIKIAWNIGIGCFPVPKNIFLNRFYVFTKKCCCILAFFSLNIILKKIIFIYILQMKNFLKEELNLKNKLNLINARFSFEGYSNSVGYNRKLIFCKIIENKNFIKGRISSWKYTKELSKTIAMLSPFGWGEICYRDFESILNRNLLVKPDMEHLETWPNIYKDDHYFKLDWDSENLFEIENYIIKNKIDIYSKIQKSISVYLNALEDCSKRAESLLDEVLIEK